MNADFGQEYELQSAIKTFLHKHGFPVESIEAGYLPLKNGERMLCVNFMPGGTWQKDNIQQTRNMICCLILHMVRNGITKHLTGIQSAVNAKVCIHGTDQYVVCGKYWCDADRLRELERSRWSLLKPLRRRSFDQLISGEQIMVVPKPSFDKPPVVTALPLPS